jgi:hypothetical protein
VLADYDRTSITFEAIIAVFLAQRNGEASRTAEVESMSSKEVFVRPSIGLIVEERPRRLALAPVENDPEVVGSFLPTRESTSSEVSAR